MITFEIRMEIKILYKRGMSIRAIARELAFLRHKRRAQDPAPNWLMAQLKTAMLRF
ncbi:helix-turn-helix domain-containing protein [Salmonella enterica subsp. indica]|uniref:Putative transposase n=1 Tax=Salmonella enterica subsp. indica TaxID=59207 RepID=A0A379XPV6_SALER|nr:helix-turn-helix domain-containing protein [Salmonella enterica subsp. arizonae]ECC3875710.1 helix-turn-helix domain-containing protein [Salmonella enterica subsp. indica]ECI8271524.1 helix-turn-helix domain-containing protein [Salmonella enterica subsp. enterica]EDR2771176.1 helix-turn-helix domain-containing protein [Salmonella enterica subsp. enterica serovar Oslo]EEC4247582.1 helix-turn-helix domain-containing protein [Salmonella enterica subsp. diarizonae]MBA3101408.1 helix-turn-helix 